LIGKSSLSNSVTVKGGVVMQHLSGDSRRATQDFDFDFIKHSLSEHSIRSFIEGLGEQTDDISISITAPLEELKHQNYNGKRVYISITDRNGTSIDTKLDIGVHNNLGIEQDYYCFDLSKLDDSVTLLINTKEQIFAEKLKSLLRIGALTTRFKDIYDMYWISEHGGINKSAMQADIKSIILDDTSMWENSKADVVSRLESVFNDPFFITSLGKSRRHNWVGIAPEQVTKAILISIQDFLD